MDHVRSGNIEISKPEIWPLSHEALQGGGVELFGGLVFTLSEVFWILRPWKVRVGQVRIEDEVRQLMAAKAGLFAQQNLAENLRYSPDGPNFGQFASSEEAR